MFNRAGQKIIGYYTEDGKVFLEKDCSYYYGGSQAAAAAHSVVYSHNHPDKQRLTVYQICEQDVVEGRS